jgi:hypothetical protein
MRPYPIGNGTVSPRVPKEFAALMDALQLEGSNTDALLALDDAEWLRLLEFCDLSHLALALSQVDHAKAPDWVRSRLNRNVCDNARRFELVRAAYIEAAAALRHAGVPHVVLKGFTQYPDYVGDPRLRFQSDIDIYCPQQQIETAQAALMRIGYRPVDGWDYSRADHVPSLSRQGNWTWRGNHYDPEMPPGIELHFCFWNERVNLIEIPEVGQFWGRRESRRLAGMDVCGLNGADHIGYLSLHILRGVLSGDWVIHHVFELARFLHTRSRDVEFWSQWHDGHSSNLRSLEAIGFCLARSWFSCALPELARVEADRLPQARKEWLRRFGGSPLEVMFRRNKDGKLLQLLLATSRTSRKSALLGAILPHHVAGPDETDVGMKNRRPVRLNASRYVKYVAYLVDRVVVNCAANLSFLLHGVKLWLSTRALSAQFWLLVSASLFWPRR